MSCIESRFYTPSELAKLCKVSVMTIGRWAAIHSLPWNNITKHWDKEKPQKIRRLIHGNDFRRWVAAHGFDVKGPNLSFQTKLQLRKLARESLEHIAGEMQVTKCPHCGCWSMKKELEEVAHA